MRFAHFSDTHLGFRQYGIYEREMDFYRAFEKAVAAMIKEKPDFVLHSGDLFDIPKPPPRALWVAQRCFSKLREKGIPVYAITGNHDMLLRKGSMPAHMLYRDMGVRLLTEEEPFVMHGDVFVSGVPYYSRHYSERLQEMLKTLSARAEKNRRSVIMIHQGTDRHLPKAFELEMGNIPKNFSYYAMGHVHSRITEDFGKGKFVYPGSTELWSANEYPDYKRKGKGFALVDMHGDEPSVQNVDIELEREIMRERFDGGSMEESLKKLGERISSSNRPLLYLDVKEGGFERSAIHELLSSKLSGHVLSLRLGFESALKDQKGTIERSFDLPQIHEIIKEMLKDRDKSKLANALFRTLSEGNDEQALKEAESFFGSLEAKS